MNPSQRTLLAALLACATAPVLAGTVDTGPMGVEAGGAPTPDAALLSKMRLPDAPAPKPLTRSVTTASQRTASRKARFHPLWLRIQSFTSRVDESEKLGRLPQPEASQARRDLSALQDKYMLRKESDGLNLAPKQRLGLETDLAALEARVSQSLSKSPAP